MCRLFGLLACTLLFSGWHIAETACPAETQNAIFRELTQVGVNLDGETMAKLPLPALPDHVGADAEKPILKKAAGRYSLGLFLKDSRSAPFSLTIQSINNAKGQRVGQSVDLFFVCHGGLKVINDHDLVDELGLLEPPSDEKGGSDTKLSDGSELEPEQLDARGITLAHATDEFEERIGYFMGSLLRQVQISGVTHTAIIKSDTSILVAARTDPRFANDTEFPNRWRAITKNDLGATELGPAQLYRGFGGYAKITPLHDPRDAVLIECRVVFSESPQWFDGKNLLRSKLPIAIKNNVSDFRRKLIQLTK